LATDHGANWFGLGMSSLARAARNSTGTFPVNRSTTNKRLVVGQMQEEEAINDNHPNQHEMEMETNSEPPIKRNHFTIYTGTSLPEPMEDDELDNSAPISESVPDPPHSMEVESTAPLIVMDGANIAHAYSDVKHGPGSEPNAHGIELAIDYFVHNCRVLVVIPAHWLRRKPQPGDCVRNNALMETTHLETLQKLMDRHLLCMAPPTDDDDAYMLAIARRNANLSFIVSNDLYRDAIDRDEGRTGLKKWLDQRRISFMFCHLDGIQFVPNPRHELVSHLEQQAFTSF